MLHPLEIETLKDIVRGANMDDSKIDSIIDLRLNFAQNKRIVKEWIKGEGNTVDLRSELVAEKELSTKLTEAAQLEAEAKEAEKYAKVKARISEVNNQITSHTKDMMDEIDNYNPYCKRITYATLFATMNAKHGKQKTHSINKGKQGIGKSRGTSELVRKLDIPDAVIISGFVTPKKLYETLKIHRNQIVVLDESEMIMNNPMALFILRSALYGGTVAWLSTRGDTEDQFDFNGTIIANMNHFGVKESEAQPLFDRTLFNEVNLSNSQIVDKMKSASTYKMNEGLWQIIKDKATMIRSEGLLELTDEEEQYIMHFIEQVAASSSIYNTTLSTRARHRAILVARCLKSLYCKLDDTVKALFEELARPYIALEGNEDLAVKLLKENPSLSRLELAELIAKDKSISVRQATRDITSAIMKGHLIAVNRTKVIIPTEVKT